jgi:SAF domain
MIGLGLALTALGGLGSAWLASSGAGTTAVVGVAREVRAGQVIQRQDLASVEIATGSGLRSVPVQRAEDVVGKRTLVRLLPGSLVNPDAVADKLVPAPGQALVGLSLAPGQRPAVPMDAGDPVEIVYTPGSQDTASPGAVRTPPVHGVVVSTVEDPDSNKTIVNVTVATEEAAKVATWGSAGRATIAGLPAGQG